MAYILRELHIVHLHFVCVLYALARLLSALSIFLEGAQGASHIQVCSWALVWQQGMAGENQFPGMLSLSKMRMSTRLIKGIFSIICIDVGFQ